MGRRSCEGRYDLYEAIKRGLDFQRDPGTFSPWPYPTIVGSLNTFAGQAGIGSILHYPAPDPSPYR